MLDKDIINSFKRLNYEYIIKNHNVILCYFMT